MGGIALLPLKTSYFKIADGMGLEPKSDFRRCRFSRSAKGSPGLPTRKPRKQGRSDSEAVLEGPTGTWPKTRNRAKPRHNKTYRDHSPDKSATSRGWYVSKVPMQSGASAGSGPPSGSTIYGGSNPIAPHEVLALRITGPRSGTAGASAGSLLRAVQSLSRRVRQTRVV